MACVLYTSGSTGLPKAVAITHHNLANYVRIWEVEFQRVNNVTTILQTAFFAFAVFQGDLVRAVCGGRKLVLTPQGILGRPSALFDHMVKHDVDFAEFVPAVLRGLVAYVDRTEKTIGKMRLMAVGADRWYVHEHKRTRRLLNRNAVLLHVYGASETTFDSTFFHESAIDLPEEMLTPIGKPVCNVKTYLLDEMLRPVPFGVTGEIFVGGAGVASGYIAGGNTGAFIPAPDHIKDAGRLFRTGDLGYRLPDGNIVLLGRRDHQIKINGFRVEVGEVELHLQRHAKVSTAVVDATEESTQGVTLTAYVVAKDGETFDTTELVAYLRKALPGYMVPRTIRAIDEIPLTPSGKVDRKLLREMRDSLQNDQDFGGGSLNFEDRVLRICRRALSTNAVVMDTELATLGIDSMSAVQIISDIEDEFKLDLEEELSNVPFDSPRQLCAFVRTRLGDCQRSSDT